MHLTRVGHARGVAQGDALHTQIRKALHPAQHFGLRHIALHGAAKAARQRDVDGRCRLLRHSDDLFERFKRLTALHAQIAEVMRLADGHHQVQLIGMRINGALRAAHIGYQRRIDGARLALDLTHHNLAIAQRGDGLWRDKSRHFNLGQPSLRQRIDQRNLVLSRYKCGLHLQAITRADFVDIDTATRTIPDIQAVH